MDMRLWRRLALALSLLVLPAPWSGPALAADATAGASPDLHLSTSETPGETTVRVPLASEGYRLYGLLSPYLSLGSATTLGVPWSASLVPGLQRGTRTGSTTCASGRGWRCRSRIGRSSTGSIASCAAASGRSPLQREPDSSDFRAGFSIRLD